MRLVALALLFPYSLAGFFEMGTREVFWTKLCVSKLTSWCEEATEPVSAVAWRRALVVCFQRAGADKPANHAIHSWPS